MRLIDADSLETHEIYEGEWVRVVYADDIDNAPTIEDEPVKHGRWIRVSPARIYECSICGQNIMAKYIDCYKFCFGCGAKMDEVDDETD